MQQQLRNKKPICVQPKIRRFVPRAGARSSATSGLHQLLIAGARSRFRLSLAPLIWRVPVPLFAPTIMLCGLPSLQALRQGPRDALGRFDLRSRFRRVHCHRHRDGKHRCGPASARGPQAAKRGQSWLAKVLRSESAVDLPCAAHRLAIAVRMLTPHWKIVSHWPSLTGTARAAVADISSALRRSARLAGARVTPLVSSGSVSRFDRI